MYRRGILHDPVMYPEPEKFMPERFIKDGAFDCSKNDPSRAAFGFGRRYASIKGLFPELNLTYLNASSSVCPGRPFAEDSLWLFVAQFLSVFDILPTDPKALPEARFTDGAAP